MLSPNFAENEQLEGLLVGSVSTSMLFELGMLLSYTSTNETSLNMSMSLLVGNGMLGRTSILEIEARFVACAFRK